MKNLKEIKLMKGFFCTSMTSSMPNNENGYNFNRSGTLWMGVNPRSLPFIWPLNSILLQHYSQERSWTTWMSVNYETIPCFCIHDWLHQWILTEHYISHGVQILRDCQRRQERRLSGSEDWRVASVNPVHEVFRLISGRMQVQTLINLWTLSSLFKAMC